MQSLTKVIFKNSKRTDKSGFLALLAFAIVFGSLGIAMVLISTVVTKSLEKINQTYAFINILLLMNFLILFGKSIFESLNLLYFSKDLKILLRMPIKPIEILHSKFINMIISEYEMEAIMLAIPMIIYGDITKAGIMFYIYAVIVLLILPIIPILITSLVISVIMRLTNKIKNKNKVMYIAIILTTIIIGIILSSMGSGEIVSNSRFEEIVRQTNGIAENISKVFILIKQTMNILLQYDNIQGLQNLIIFIAENIIFYIIILFIISKIYLKGAIGTTINSRKNAKSAIQGLSEKDFKPKRINKSYILKELRTILRTPIFLIQCIIIPTIYPIVIISASLLLVNFANNFIPAWDLLYKNAVTCLGAAMFLSLGQVFYMMNFTSIIAISRESKNAILTKYIPISLQKQFKLKVSLGVLLNLLAGILVTIFYYMSVHNVFATILIAIELVILNIIGEKFKLLTDLRKPQIDWNSEYTMMKQNTNVMYILFYTLLVVGILLGISVIINQTEIFLIATIVISEIINISINRYINKNDRKIFAKLY